MDALVAYEIENYQTDKAMGDKSKLPSDYLVEPDNAASLNSFVSSTQDSRMILMYPVSTMIMMTVTILLVAFVVTAVHACHPRTVGEIFGLYPVCGM